MHQIRQNAHPTSGMIDDRDRAARRTRTTRRSRHSIDDRDRTPRRSSTRCDRRTSGTIVDRAARQRGEARSSLSLSDLVLVFSLSLFFQK